MRHLSHGSTRYPRFVGRCPPVAIAVAVVLFIAGVNGVVAQQDARANGASDHPDALRLYIRTQINATSHSSIRESYFREGKDSILTDEVSEALAERLRARVTAYGLSHVSISKLSGQEAIPDVPADRSYLLLTNLSFDSNLQITVNAVLMRTVDEREVNRLSSSVFTADQFRIEWNDLIGRPDAAAPALLALGRQISEKIEFPVYRWIIDSTVRFIVRVQGFRNESPETGHDYITSLLRTAVHTELTQSPGLSLIDVNGPDESSTRPDRNDYTVDGTFIVKDGQILVDLRVVKNPVARVLVSRRAVLDKLDLTTLSNSLTRLAREVRWAMEADFRHEKKTLAVVGVPARSPLAKGDLEGRDVAAVGEIARSFTRKLNLLARPDARPLLDLVIRDVVVDATRSAVSNSFSWLVDSDADYLVLVNYQDLGDRVRLSTDLDFYDPEHPAVRLPIRERIVDKADVEAEVDASIWELVTILGRYAVTSREITSGLADSVRTLVQSVPMHSIVRGTQAGVRFGAVFLRPTTDFFFGENAGNYLELYLSRMLPALYDGGRGGQFGVGVETVLGIDLGEDASLGGAAVASGFVNLKVYLTRWKHSRTRANVVVGGGPALLALRYRFAPGDRYYTGTEKFKDTGFAPTFNVFVLGESPIWKSFESDLLVRWLPATPVLETFENASASGIGTKSNLSGSLGGLYTTIGLKYRY